MTWLRVLATWLIADASLSLVFAELAALRAGLSRLDQAQSQGNPPQSRPPFRIAIPYAVPGSPGARLAGRLSFLIADAGNQASAVRCGIAAVVGAGVSLVLAVYLGRQMLSLVSGGLAVALILVIVVGGDAGLMERWLDGLHVALAWALGYLVLAPWRSGPLGLAALAGVSAYARTRLGQERRGAASWMLAAVWVVWVAVLLLAKQPILAMAVAMAALAEHMSLGRGGRAAGSWQPDNSRLFLPDLWSWLLAMLVVALAVAHWD